MDEILSGKTIKQWQDEATAAERERCARVAEMYYGPSGDFIAKCIRGGKDND